MEKLRDSHHARHLHTHVALLRNLYLSSDFVKILFDKVDNILTSIH